MAARLGAGLVFAGLLAGAAQAQGEKVWRHGIIEAKSDAGILFMVQRGFAEKNGLKLELTQVKTDQIGLKALLAGELDSYEGGPGGAILAAARGADVKIAGCHWITVPHGIFVHAHINSMQDLVGKSIAVSSPGTMPEMLARGALNKFGVPIDSVKLASLGGDLDRYKALLAKVVDAAVVSGEYTPVADKEGLKLLVPGREALPNFIRICIHMTGKTLAQRGDDAVRFLAAESQALRHALTHKEEAIKLTRELTNAKPDDPRPAFIFDLAAQPGAVMPDLPIPIDKLEWLQNQLVAGGNLQKAGDIGKMVDQNARAKALELAGK
jgi:NitT/TauT family transport system substrate-binding protein